jgi:type VI secretion system protein ImpC
VDLAALISRRIAQIDETLSAQLNEVVHAEPFQQLESAWRGLHYLVSNTETGTNLKLRVMHASKKELLDDLQKASEFDQSALFKKVYEEEYGTFGGHPFSVLLGDYEFSRHPQDMALLEKLSQWPRRPTRPFLSAAQPQAVRPGPLHGHRRAEGSGEGLRELRAHQVARLSRVGGVTLRGAGDAAHVAAAALWREDGAGGGLPLRGGRRREQPREYLWGNAAYALGQRITQAFSLYGWSASIRGVEGGGIVQGCPRTPSRRTRGTSPSSAPPRWPSPTGARRS